MNNVNPEWNKHPVVDMYYITIVSRSIPRIYMYYRDRGQRKFAVDNCKLPMTVVEETVKLWFIIIVYSMMSGYEYFILVKQLSR